MHADSHGRHGSTSDTPNPFFHFIGALNPNEFNGQSKEFVKALFMVNQYFLMDEATQVAGIMWMVDYTGFGLSQQTFLTLKDKKNMGLTFPVKVAYIHMLGC